MEEKKKKKEEEEEKDKEEEKEKEGVVMTLGFNRISRNRLVWVHQCTSTEFD